MTLPLHGITTCVSVIVPTYNSSKFLSTCLRALKQQRYPFLEILVIDNYSTDGTRSIAEAFGARVILHKGTQAAARNQGILHSKCDFVLFLDSDQQLQDEVVKDCFQLCISQGADAVKIPEVFVGMNFWGRCSALWKNSLVTAWGSGGGIPRFYKKEILVSHSAFNDKLRWWEDMELFGRLSNMGLKVAWCNGRVFHFEAVSPHYMILKYLSYGRSINKFEDGQVTTLYKRTIALTLSTLIQTLRDSWKSIPVFIGCMFLVAVKSLSAIVGFLSRLK